MAELRKTWYLMDTHGITLSVRYIRSAANIWADRLSREVDCDDWQFNPRRFASLTAKWGACTIDRFATSENALLPRYNARWRDPRCEAVDALRLSDAAWRCEPLETFALRRECDLRHMAKPLFCTPGVTVVGRRGEGRAPAGTVCTQPRAAYSNGHSQADGASAGKRREPCRRNASQRSAAAQPPARHHTPGRQDRRDQPVLRRRAQTDAPLLAAAALLGLPAAASAAVMVAPGSYMDDASVWGAVALTSGKHHTTQPASWRGSRTSCIICIVTCRCVWLTSFGCAAGASAAALARANNPEGALAELQRRWRAAELLEVRLDLTVLWCYALGRELLRNFASPEGIQIQLGFNGEKLAHLLAVCGSGSLLSVAWIAAGVVTRHFERQGFHGSLQSYMAIAWATCLSAGAVWQLGEQYLYSQARPELMEAVPLDWGGAAWSVAALSAAMLSYRLFCWHVPE
eukprot:jgi/Tetstr1/442587/TSEL_030683.t1